MGFRVLPCSDYAVDVLGLSASSEFFNPLRDQFHLPAFVLQIGQGYVTSYSLCVPELPGVIVLAIRDY